MATESTGDSEHDPGSANEAGLIVESLHGTNPLKWVPGFQQRCLLISGDGGLVQTRTQVGTLAISVSKRPPSLTSGVVTGDRQIVTFPMTATRPAKVNGTRLTQSYFAISGRGAEAEVVELDPWVSANIVFSGGSNFLDTWRDGSAMALFSVSPEALRPIRELVVRILEAAATPSENLADGGFCVAINDAIVLALTDLKGSPRKQLNPYSHAAARRIVRDIDAFITDAGPGNVTAVNLSRAVGRSLRTIHDSLTAIKGLGLSKYLLVRRLSAVRHALETSAPGTMVKAIALENGFWHLGRFAKRYREMYGESPSETRRHWGAA
jgi:AraC-like DNA-binding protein